MASTESQSLSAILSFPFKDPQWVVKLAIGSLLVLSSLIIPLLPLFPLAGYNLRIIQRIIRGDGRKVLPEWEDWDWLFKHGFKLSEAGLFYALPGLLLFTGGYVMLFYPLLVMSLAYLASGTPQPASDQAATLLTAGAILTTLGTLLTLIGAFFSAPAAMHMAAKDEVKAIFKVREWGAILTRALGRFGGAYGVIAAAFILVSLVFTILSATLVFCLPAALIFSAVTAYLLVVASALFSLAYRAGM